VVLIEPPARWKSLSSHLNSEISVGAAKLDIVWQWLNISQVFRAPIITGSLMHPMVNQEGCYKSRIFL
jgi:hypothetical protein